MFVEKRWNYYLTVVPIVAFVVVFFIWAAFSHIDEDVRGSGKVVPSGQTKILQHMEGGIVADILVKEGQQVNAGQPIYRLDQAFFTADMKEKDSELAGARAKEARLTALLQGRAKPAFDPDTEKNYPEIVTGEMQIFYAERQNASEHVGSSSEIVQQRAGELRELQTKYTNLSAQLDTARESAAISEKLMRSGAGSKKEYLNELAKKQDLATQLDEIRHQIPIAQGKYKEASFNMGSGRSDIQAKWLNDLKDARLKIAQLSGQTQANNDRVQRLSIVSPVRGIVNKLYFYTKGGTIKPGDKVAEVTPIDDNLLIEANIKASDRARIWVGQRASIEITAYDYAKYGRIDGTLVSISPDSTTNQKGETFYDVQVKASRNKIAPNMPIMPGMEANINIITGKRTVLSYIFLPLKRMGQNSLGEP